MKRGEIEGDIEYYKELKVFVESLVDSGHIDYTLNYLLYGYPLTSISIYENGNNVNSKFIKNMNTIFPYGNTIYKDEDEDEDHNNN